MVRIKALLADEDKENLKNFRLFINKNFKNIKIVSTTDDIKDFMSNVKQYEPQLIIGDIRFFGARGYHILREATELYPDIRLIVYGAYSDTDYIQKIAPLGVIDYIYRPVKPSDLNRSLERAMEVYEDIETVRKKEEILIDDYISSIPVFKNKFLYNVLMGNVTNEFEVNNSFNYFDIKIESPYTVMLVRIDHFKKLILAFDEKGKNVLVYRILTLVNQKLNEIGNGVAFIENLNAIAIILGGEKSLKELIKIGEEIIDVIFVQTDVNVTVGLGGTYYNLRDISVSFREADAAFRYRNYIGYGSVIPIEYVEPYNKITHRYPLYQEDKLVFAAVSGQYKYSMELLKSIIDALDKSGDLPKGLLSKIIMNIVISINRYVSEQGMPIDNFTDFFPSSEIFKINTTVDAYNFLEKSLKRFCDFILELKEEDKERIVETVKTFLDTNFMFDISLSDIAIESGTTPDFMQKCFAEYENISINNYIDKKRIDLAQVIISETEDDDDVVSQRVGYTDVKRFRNIFYRLTGMHTQEYRREK